MTQPPSPSQASPAVTLAAAVPPLVFEHDTAALALEDEAALVAAGAVRNQLADIFHTFGLRWIREFGTLRTPASGAAFTRLMTDLAAELARIQVDPAPVLLDYANRAADLGVRQGWREASLEPRPLPSPAPIDTHLRIAGVAQDARQKTRAGQALAHTLPPGTFNQTVQRAATPLQQATNVIERAARTITNERLNTGLGAVITATGGQRLWLAERDACLTCQALNGQVIDEGASFPSGTAFGGHIAQYAGESFDAPPAHENCRCRITFWRGEQTPTSLPVVLRREAERSVLHGWALPSESNRARTKAADALLHQISSRHGLAPSGWDVPESVVRSTGNRLKKGTFGVTPFPARKSR